MQTLSNLALGLCLLCAAAGMIRVFWPDDRFKPVINTVLALYILTSMFGAGNAANWQAVAREVGQLTVPAGAGADYDDYARELGATASADAIVELLSQRGVRAETSWQGETLCIRLRDVNDREAAEQLLRENAGTLAYAFVQEGGGQS